MSVEGPVCKKSGFLSWDWVPKIKLSYKQDLYTVSSRSDCWWKNIYTCNMHQHGFCIHMILLHFYWIKSLFLVHLWSKTSVGFFPGRKITARSGLITAVVGEGIRWCFLLRHHQINFLFSSFGLWCQIPNKINVRMLLLTEHKFNKAAGMVVNS